MKIIKELEDLQPEMQNWRRDIHAHPEIAFEEHRTAKIVADKTSVFVRLNSRSIASPEALISFTAGLPSILSIINW